MYILYCNVFKFKLMFIDLLYDLLPYDINSLMLHFICEWCDKKSIRCLNDSRYWYFLKTSSTLFDDKCTWNIILLISIDR